jgi:surface antigen
MALFLIPALPATAASIPIPLPRPGAALATSLSAIAVPLPRPDTALALLVNSIPVPLARPDGEDTPASTDLAASSADEAAADALADASDALAGSPTDTRETTDANPQPVSIAGVKVDKSSDDTPRIVQADMRLSCVPFARALSGIDIQGNAATWWAKAKGIYARLTQPKAGAVMVFASTSHMRAGHVAVVKDVVSSREVRVDHANWGRDGKVYLNAPVVDVSRNNDWSEVRVWNTELGVLGTHIYKLSGFVAE